MRVFGGSRRAKPRMPRSEAEYDFVTVYFRELCCHSRPKRQKFGSESCLLSIVVLSFRGEWYRLKEYYAVLFCHKLLLFQR